MLETVIRANHKCIFLPKFHCELNPIEIVFMKFTNLLSIYYSIGVGYSKYRYRQVSKNTFKEAKDAAEVIRRFMNRSWKWMSAYRTGMGLMGKAAQWAVRKQKGHRSHGAASRTDAFGCRS
jgi:hypothetical protein